MKYYYVSDSNIDDLNDEGFCTSFTTAKEDAAYNTNEYIYEIEIKKKYIKDSWREAPLKCG